MSRLLVIGAGASVEECLRANVPSEDCFPTIKNFARQLWNDDDSRSAANQFIDPYLRAIGRDPGDYPLETFKKAEAIGELNVERFFEWAWHSIRPTAPDRWRDLLRWCLFEPFNFLTMKHFWVNDVGLKEMKAGMAVARGLHEGDAVLNLNYDVLFDIAARQAGWTLTYLPNAPKDHSMWMAKPHGSFNLFVNVKRELFAFGDPIQNLGALRTPDPQGGFWENEPGFVPPRFGKSYEQHPAAAMILAPLKRYSASELTFWGIGLTDSDIDLLDLFREKCASATGVEFINPSEEDFKKARDCLGRRDARHFPNLDDWLGETTRR